MTMQFLSAFYQYRLEPRCLYAHTYSGRHMHANNIPASPIPSPSPYSKLQCVAKIEGYQSHTPKKKHVPSRDA